MGTTALRAAAIVRLHERLLANFEDELACGCFIDQHPQFRTSKPESSWRRSSGGKAIYFYLWSDEERKHPNAFFEAGLPAVQLYEPDATATDLAWVSWIEKWQLARKTDTFELQALSMRFYWGRPLAIQEQLFRAEWDQSNADPSRSRTLKAAHPHWHIDWPVNSITAISGIHLGMGGWKGDGESPLCWQSDAESEEQVVEWASKTISYGRQQLRDYPPKYQSLANL